MLWKDAGVDGSISDLRTINNHIWVSHDTLVGDKSLTPTDKYFRSPYGLFFECRGIAWDVPITIDKIEVHLDFDVYDILNFDLLLG